MLVVLWLLDVLWRVCFCKRNCAFTFNRSEQPKVQFLTISLTSPDSTPMPDLIFQQFVLVLLRTQPSAESLGMYCVTPSKMMRLAAFGSKLGTFARELNSGGRRRASRQAITNLPCLAFYSTWDVSIRDLDRTNLAESQQLLI